MTDANTTAGRVLALNLAAVEDRREVNRLIQDHIATYPREEGLYVLAVALSTLAAEVLWPAVERMQGGAEFREQHREAVRRILAGPIEKEK